uniref:splicing regulatory glutamine/lysine-rich protein 1-like n=1 Tax=Ciona intestinalis TaxID=7719 RepID=UPI00006A5B74|nr:splicing regulatory glutamine/lysine-rich protein 1-like [Ciona intestinalis]|eukprot:XP_002129672.1 splicing regulatory glutamine/lysine-rich protein 1-like [Ciona intestinalis]
MATTDVIQVTNIAPTATLEQIHTLFDHLGTFVEFELFPRNPDPNNPGTKVAFIKYADPSSVGVAQHLTSTVFIDRALICVPYTDGIIPNETVAMQFATPATALIQAGGVIDQTKLDEIKRTIYVGNLDSKQATADQLMTFFGTCGEVKFVRMAGDETQPTRFAFIEFAKIEHVDSAMKLNGTLFGDRALKINHSNNAIVKPAVKPVNDTATKEIDEAMKRVREAQSLISRALDPEKSRRRSRSRSRSRHRHRRKSRSRDRSRRRRSRSKSRGRSRRSRSRSRKRSHRSRSRSRDHKKRKSRSRSRKRSRSRSHSKKSSRHRRDRKRDHKDRDKDKKKSKGGDDKEEGKTNGADKEATENVAPMQQNGEVAAAT